MKKGFLLVAIVLWTLVAAAIAGLIIFSVNGGFEAVLIKDESISLGDIRNIVVEGSHQAVEIRETGGDSIKVSQYGNAKTRSEALFSVSTSDDGIRIYFDDIWYFNLFSFNINEKLVVEIPEDFTGNLEAEASSGGLNIEDEFTLKSVSLQSSSGGIYIERDITADEDITVKSSSGGIEFNGTVTAKNLYAETSSGEIRLGDVKVESYYFHSSSGRIKAESISGGGEAETSSGGIQLSLKNPKGDIKLTSSSGGIKITLESSLQFTLDARTGSGGIHTNFTIEKNENGNKATAKIGDNPVANIIAQASSGGIKVEN